MTDAMVQIPELTIMWDKRGTEGIAIRDAVFPGGSGLTIGCKGFRPRPVIRKTATVEVAVIGSPIFNDRIDPEGVADLLLLEDATTIARQLNGVFLLVRLNKEPASLTLANDRFTGIPIYWADLGERFVASHSYFELFRMLRQTPGFALRSKPMFEFIWYQRLLLDKTYDNLSRFLMPASHLTITRGEPLIDRYWRPDFTKDHSRSVQTAGTALIERLQTSVRRLTSDARPLRYGHFLSGGHDSRTVLAAFKQPPVCFTVAFSDNYEVHCARQVAKAVGAKHRFLELADDHFVRYQDAMTRLCGGMYATDNALFLGLQDHIQREADVVFHGHGLDYMFQGMYVPARLVELFGRPTFFRRLEPLDGDVAAYFMDNVPFRIANPDLTEYLLPDQRAAMRDWLRDSTRAAMEDGADVCKTNYDRYEYLINHALARHYSYPNIATKATCAEQRTVSFDNDLFDLYCSLPAEQRVTAAVMRFAMKGLHRGLARIPSGNWGIAAGASPFYKTASLVGRKALRHLTGNETLHTPHAEDRTWPDRDQYLASHPGYQALVREALGSDLLADALPFFDWTKLRAAGNRWMERPSGGAKFLVSLMTLHRFLSQTG